MKSTITQNKDEVTYPCLRMLETDKLGAGGTVVLFDRPKEGTVVGGGTYWDVGEHATDWDMKMFVPFNGTVTLEG